MNTQHKRNGWSKALLVGCITLAGAAPTAVPAVAQAQITDEEMEKRIQDALKNPDTLKLIQCYATGVAVRNLFLKLQTETGGCLDGGKAVRGDPYGCAQVQPVRSYSLFGLQGYQLHPVPAFNCTECDPKAGKPIANPCDVSVDVTETLDINLSAGFQGIVYNGSLNASYSQKLDLHVDIAGKGEKFEPKDIQKDGGRDGPFEIIQAYQSVTFKYSVKKQHAGSITAKGGSKVVGFEANLSATQLNSCAVKINGGAFVSVMQINRACSEQKHEAFEPSLSNACPLPAKDPAPAPTPSPSVVPK
jgi:hypothetical protein